ncbi:MAG: HD domain-containing protein, partial [Sideroxydans sp.]|nr:HD domain-containing protein [Sideroxydans sp.]
MENTGSSMGAFAKAVAFAAEKHRNQRRKDAEASPYINHPIALANVLANEGGVDDVTVLCAAVLHDTIEDTETTAIELRTLFGPKVASVVMEVTDDKSP